MIARFAIPAALIIILGLPFLFKQPQQDFGSAEHAVVIISPHPESIRREFAHGFSEWYLQQTGHTASVDWRVIGGTSEIGRFLQSEFTNAFRNYWEGEQNRPWNTRIQAAFNNPNIIPGDNPADDDESMAARRAFLQSNVSSGIDIFFGGGSYDFTLHAAYGHLVDSGIMAEMPENFIEAVDPEVEPSGIPRQFGGETFYDANGRWIGAVLSSYGIIYNTDVLRRIGVESPPTQWADLADPRYRGQIAICDPTKSGAMTQAFEMILQQQMQIRWYQLQKQFPRQTAAELERDAVEEGWMTGMRNIQMIAANARYFTDSSQKPNIDVAIGDSAAGMTIDFYGRFQQENIQDRGGRDRFYFVSPENATTLSADPIGLLRGARNEETAKLFIRYVLSPDGQKLWNFKPGTPGGPSRYALRRLPILPAVYREEWSNYRSDPSENPYDTVGGFHYHRAWTGRLFSELRIIIRICFMDIHNELVEAWAAIDNARQQGFTEQADKAMAVFQNLEAISYPRVENEIRSELRASRLNEVQLARNMSNHFRRQYQIARDIANKR